MAEITRAAVPVFLDEDGNPRGFIWWNQTLRERIIYCATKADEDAIIGLYENKDIKLRTVTLKGEPVPREQR